MDQSHIQVLLEKSNQFPTDKRIAGIHCIPVTDQGMIVMAWDKDEQVLTTIGGRVEGNETLTEALDREALEEAGIVLGSERIPFATWYWTNTDTYTIYVLARIASFLPMKSDFEKSGYVIFNFDTATQMILKAEGAGERTQILGFAEELATELGWI